VLTQHIANLEANLIVGHVKPNCSQNDHVLQVITGPGKLADKVNDFLTMAGYEVEGKRDSGSFLVRLTNKQADSDAHKNRIAEIEAMRVNHIKQWEEAKEEVKSQKNEFKNSIKSEKNAAKAEAKAQKVA